MHRDEVRDRLLRLAANDPVIIGAAITGSGATGAADSWSDLDLALGVGDHDLAAVLDRWTRIMIEEFGALHHWDLPAADWIYRVFLLPGLLEVDLGFAPTGQWGPRADSWRTIFGDPIDQREESPVVDVRTWTGYLWHHLLHARTATERGHGLQAAYWIGAARELIIESACRRHGLPTAYGKGAHLLPYDLRTALGSTLVGSVSRTELRRATRELLRAARAELQAVDPPAAEVLLPALAPLGGAGDLPS
ncbi:hypothetical protein [Microlunatus sp. Gsoil 973]|jgi:hypothetical protein|uniref:hypothetical protein n=1 Tax=Microlunatus sp. Gsoil 973 TaxID=2672569 RepID=UPI0012B46DF5|nr:hypothetical protein [Microlunatus sp. Gsoil 973]QGN34705.1 hypothetical protein GJV80_19825 [Microlunatus sp. Gsoil 973]